ncbi:MAG: GNAT family N-acetyltransferase [Planctomycetes bacterium]|nr:GNAT family N-acetyltransferase [Planctomycetota bacterium]
MELRRAALDDAKGIARIMKEGYNIDTIADAEGVFTDEMERFHRYVVATMGYDIMGFASWTLRDLPRHELAELRRIAIHKEHRHKGIGAGLFYYLVQDAKRYYHEQGFRLRKMFTTCHASNNVARAFYEKIGFKLEATLKDHYYEGEDECIYSTFF